MAALSTIPNGSGPARFRSEAAFQIADDIRQAAGLTWPDAVEREAA